MKKALIVLLIGVCLFGMAGCGNSLNYQVLVNKTHPISKDYIENVTLVSAMSVYGDEVQVEETAYRAYSDLYDALMQEGIEIGRFLLQKYRETASYHG